MTPLELQLALFLANTLFALLLCIGVLASIAIVTRWYRDLKTHVGRVFAGLVVAAVLALVFAIAVHS